MWRALRVAARAAGVWLLMGHARQSFVGARWIAGAVRWFPRRHRPALALRLLAMSPHYFIPRLNPAGASAGSGDLLAAEFERNRASRRRLWEQVLRPFLQPGSTVLDYGCGAGFLAATAGESMRVYAVDIAEGVLACAEALNPHPSVRYLPADDRGFGRIPNGSVDAAWLVAVTQHLTADELQRVLSRCAAKLRDEGKLLMHVALRRESWWSEEEWRGDHSVRGRMAFQYSLNCFRRDAGDFLRALDEHGFEVEQVVPIATLCGGEHFDDICADDLIVARRRSRP